MPKILAFAGSARADSCNKKLLNAAVQFARDAGANVSIADFRELEMPLFDQDLEANDGMPANAKRFKQMLIEADGLLIASPEYNSSFSPLMKNAIDWASRAETDDEPPLIAYRGKTAAIIAASPGGLGGLRGLVPLRMLLGNIGITVIPDQFALGGAYSAFDENGLIDEKKAAQLKRVTDALVKTTEKLTN